MKMDCHALRAQAIIVIAFADAGQYGKSEYAV